MQKFFADIIFQIILKSRGISSFIITGTCYNHRPWAFEFSVKNRTNSDHSATIVSVKMALWCYKNNDLTIYYNIAHIIVKKT